MSSNIREFNQIISKIAKTLPEEAIVPFQQKIVFDVFSGAVEDTRVRTGRARGGWQVGLDEIPTGPGTKSKTGDGTKKRAQARLSKLKAWQIVYIANNVEYIIFLEEGTDKRPGDHMLELSLIRVAISNL